MKLVICIWQEEMRQSFSDAARPIARRNEAILFGCCRQKERGPPARVTAASSQNLNRNV